MNPTLLKMGQEAQAASRILSRTSPAQKNQALEAMAQALLDHQEDILKANQEDITQARQQGMAQAMIERLLLNPDRLQAMANGLTSMAQLADPTTETIKEWTTDQGLRISQRRVPLGVIAMIYEARPNVTADASGLCLKSGNAVILRGGREALSSNQAIVVALQEGLQKAGLPVTSIQLITDPSRELSNQLMQMDQYVDCLIPRGGAGLIRAVLETATVPVIETGVGNCHLYIHKDADLETAQAMIVNGKLQRPSVCNATETLLIDSDFTSEEIAKMLEPLVQAQTQLRGDDRILSIVPGAVEIQPEDDATEFLDNILAVRVVDDLEAAIQHIQTYSSGHSEAIISENYSATQEFMDAVDAATVYVNASTRFSDGGVFGFGGEIGISTQKLHARGPMGLQALTSYKYVIQGQGQIRE